MVKKFFFLIVTLLATSRVSGDSLILLSSDIKPYTQVAQGILSSNNNHGEIKFLNDQPQDIYLYWPWFAIGGEALKYLLTNSNQNPIYFGLVESPNTIVKNNRIICGYRIEPNPSEVTRFVKEILSALKLNTIYIFTNPSFQSSYIKFLLKTIDSELKTQFILINNKKKLVIKFKSMIKNIKILLLLPDSGVIQKETVEQLLKVAVKNQIIVIGYNSWFIKNGALFAFYIPYKLVGKKLFQLSKKGCSTSQFLYPPLKLTVNETLLKRWKLNLPSQFPASRWEEK